MAIEVKQLLIKSTVLHSRIREREDGYSDRDDVFDSETLKQEIVADCRALLREMFREQKER